MTDVAVVVVGINSLGYVRGCLQSLRLAEWRDYSSEIVYVDNASVDGSVEMVRSEFPEVLVIENSTNVGFCAACNQAVNQVQSRYVYLLNNDTVLFEDSVWPLIEFLDSHSEAAAAGNRLLNPDHTDQWSARRFPTWINAIFGRRTSLGRFFPASATVNDYLYKEQMRSPVPFRVDWIPGSCTLVRRSAYFESGQLPEDMHYWSDALFCDRLGKLGYDVYIVPTARLIHFEGKGTGGKTNLVRHWLIRDFHTGAFRFYCEHFELGRANPVRWLAGVALGLRARVLIGADLLRNRGRAAEKAAA